MKGFNSIIRAVLLAFFLYLVVFTWNWKTGVLDKISSQVGLEFVGKILYPGRWIERNCCELWKDYIALRHVREENKLLESELKRLRLEQMSLQVKEREWRRLIHLLHFSPLPSWNFLGARVLFYGIGPTNVLNSFTIDRGSKGGVKKDSPVILPSGLIGRVIKVSAHYATVLLISDSNSRVPVIAVKSRTRGILQGEGSLSCMQVLYIPYTAPLKAGELFVTSGLGGIFPKGIPVARIKKIEENPSSLFKKVIVTPVVDLANIEEVFILIPKRTQIPSSLSRGKRP